MVVYFRLCHRSYGIVAFHSQSRIHSANAGNVTEGEKWEIQYKPQYRQLDLRIILSGISKL
jgi:hypothetical protein